MKKLLFLMVALCSVVAVAAKPTVKSITSPDGKLKLTVTIENDIRWSVELDGQTIITPSKVAMLIGESEVWGENPRLRKATVGKINEVIPAPVYKKSEVLDQCSTLTLSFKGDYGIEFRAYNEAAAYRFTTTRKGDYTVKSEVAEFSFEKDNNVYCSYTRSNSNKTFEQQYFQSFEGPYFIEPMTKMGKQRLMYLPVLVDMGDKKVCITETDLVNYPGMFLYNGDKNTSLESHFATVPDEVEQGGHNMLQGLVKSRKPYIAALNGARTFPWRICNIARNDF